MDIHISAKLKFGQNRFANQLSSSITYRDGKYYILDDIQIYPLEKYDFGYLNRRDDYYIDEFYPYSVDLYRKFIHHNLFYRRNAFYHNLAYFAIMHILHANINKVIKASGKDRVTFIHYFNAYNNLEKYDRQNFANVLNDAVKFFYMLDHKSYLNEESYFVNYPISLLK